MAKVILAVPETKLPDVIAVILAGLRHVEGIEPEVDEALRNWCSDHAEYVRESLSEPILERLVSLLNQAEGS